MYDELIAVHTIMRRGAALTASALHRLADGTKLDVTALVRVARWQAGFVDHHHKSEDELFWPVLRRLFPEAVASLDALALEHETLHVELENLSSAIDAIEATSDQGADAHAAAVKLAATQALPAAEKVRDVLISHLGTEEPVLQKLFPQVPDADIVRLRKAIIAGAPRSGPDLVIGLLEDPSPAPGYASMMASFPPPIRWLRPILRRRYLARKKALQQ
jgi:hemerythrin-like domain-containing protein